MSISDFNLIKELGAGSYGKVFKAIKKGDQQTYAIKEVKLSGMDKKDRENAVNEVRLLASINIANVIKFKDTFVDDMRGILYLVMEFADGGDLQGQIQGHKKKGTWFTEEAIWKVAFELLSGLEVLHDNKIMHRDIKPANVFVVDGVFKLGDLNVSKATENGLAQTQIGTPYYTAPEIWNNEIYGPSCDIWSLGCMLYEMAALSPPFTGKDFKGLYAKIKTGVYPPISPMKYSSELSAFIKKMIVLNPKQRLTASKLLTLTKFSPLKQNKAEFEEQVHLLQTIQYPKSLKLIHDKLPESDYTTPKKKGVKIEESNHDHEPKSYKHIQSEKLIPSKSQKVLEKHLFLPQVNYHGRKASIEKSREGDNVRKLLSPMVNEMKSPVIASEKQIAGGIRKRGIF